MRATLNLDEGVLAELKRLAAESQRTVSAVTEEAIGDSLARARERRLSGPVELPTFRGRGVKRGVDLDDNAAVLERKDSLDGLRGRYRDAGRTPRGDDA